MMIYKMINKSKLAFIIFMISVSSYCFAAEKNSSTEQLKALLTPIQTLQGGFKQTVFSEGGKRLRVETGQMWLKRGGNFRWEIKGKSPHWVIGDGKQIWDYDVELEQVVVQKFSKAQGAAPIVFLTGQTNVLEKNFKVDDISKSAKGVCLQGSDTCFKLTPKLAQDNFQWIRVGFKQGKLQELEMLDQLGQRAEFQFLNLKMNESISDKLFNFIPPKGVDVIRN